VTASDSDAPKSFARGDKLVVVDCPQEPLLSLWVLFALRDSIHGTDGRHIYILPSLRNKHTHPFKPFNGLFPGLPK